MIKTRLTKQKAKKKGTTTIYRNIPLYPRTTCYLSFFFGGVWGNGGSIVMGVHWNTQNTSKIHQNTATISVGGCWGGNTRTIHIDNTTSHTPRPHLEQGERAAVFLFPSKYYLYTYIPPGQRRVSHFIVVSVLYLQLDKKLGNQKILADFGGFLAIGNFFWSPILLVQL